MKFVKGVIIGTCLSAGAYMLYMETNKVTGKKLMKKGKKWMKNMDIL